MRELCDGGRMIMFLHSRTSRTFSKRILVVAAAGVGVVHSFVLSRTNTAGQRSIVGKENFGNLKEPKDY